MCSGEKNATPTKNAVGIIRNVPAFREDCCYTFITLSRLTGVKLSRGAVVPPPAAVGQQERLKGTFKGLPRGKLSYLL